MEKSIEEIKDMIAKAPNKCPITGLKKCESYLIDDNVVYLTNPAYDAYTLPEYNEEEKGFYHTKYDMDDNFADYDQWLCGLDDLRDREDFEEIKRFYGIRE